MMWQGCKDRVMVAMLIGWVGLLPKAQAADSTPFDSMNSNKSLSDVSNNVKSAATTIADLLIFLCMMAGFVIMACSLYSIWRATKDEREKPMSSIVGMFIGGAMSAVGTIMFMVRNTLVGA